MMGMTLCCARGLANCVAGFEIEKIAAEYKEWVLSPSFDMGITIGASIGCVLKGQHSTAFKKHLEQVGYAKGEREYNRFSYFLPSNGERCCF